MYCKKCGTEMKDDAKFCPKCGASTELPIKPAAKAPKEDSKKDTKKVKNAKAKKEKKPVKKWKVITACVCSFAILVSGILGGLYWYFTRPEYSPDNNYVFFEEGFTDVKVTDEASALEAIASVGDVLGISDAKKELKIENVNTIDGDSYYRFQQMYNDIPVYGRSVVISAASDGTATALTSNAMSFDEKLVDTVSDEKVLKKVRNYFEKEYEISDDFSAKVAEMCYETLSGEIHQAYHCYAEFISNDEYFYRECFVDAKSLKVYFEKDMLNGVQKNDQELQGQAGTQIVDIDNENGINELYDETRNIVAWKATSWNFLTSGTPKAEEIKWNENEKLNEKSAVDAYANISKSYDYFDQKLNHVSTDGNGNAAIFIVDNITYLNFDEASDILNNFYLGNAASMSNTVTSNGIEIPATWIFVGKKLLGDKYRTSAYLDVIAHEYAHAVVHYASALGSGQNKQMSNSINEGYADIFGNLVEAEYSDNKIIDWTMSYVNRDAKKKVNPDKFKPGKTDEHNGAGIISHAAYLMSNGIDGNEEMKIGNDKLAKLWYRALFMLQSDATFSQCRNAVELSARIMVKNGELTDKQYECVVKAFIETGITKCFNTYSKVAKNDFNLTLLSSDESKNLASDDKDQAKLNFNLRIFEVSENGSSPTVLDDEALEAADLKKVSDKNYDSGKLDLHLKNGKYLLSFKDLSWAGEGSKTIYMYLTVDGENKEAVDNVTIYTDFMKTLTVILDPDKEITGEEKPDFSQQDLSLYIPAVEKIISECGDEKPGMLYDMDNDTFPEMIIVHSVDYKNYCSIFDIKDGKLVTTTHSGDDNQIFEPFNVGIAEYQGKKYYTESAETNYAGDMAAITAISFTLYDTKNLQPVLTLEYTETYSSGRIVNWAGTLNGVECADEETENILNSVKYIDVLKSERFYMTEDEPKYNSTGMTLKELLAYLKKTAGSEQSNTNTGETNPSSQNDTDAFKEAEEECRSAFMHLWGTRPKTIYCDDYDGDGTYEAFALIEVNGYNASLNRKGMAVCYAKNGEAHTLEILDGEADFTYNGEIQSGKYKFFSFEQSFGGSGSKSFVLGVKNGQAIAMNVSGSVMNFQKKNTDIIGCYNDFSSEGHNYIWFKFKLNEEDFVFQKSETYEFINE